MIQYTHRARYGTQLISENRGLTQCNLIQRPNYLTEDKYAADIFEIGCYWMQNVYPTLNCCQGYDTFKFKVEYID